MKEKGEVIMKNKIDVFSGVKSKCFAAAAAVRARLDAMKEDINGMGTIEVVLIVAVLVALALLFKTFITRYANTIFESIESKTENALGDW